MKKNISYFVVFCVFVFSIAAIGLIVAPENLNVVPDNHNTDFQQTPREILESPKETLEETPLTPTVPSSEEDDLGDTMDVTTGVALTQEITELQNTTAMLSFAGDFLMHDIFFKNAGKADGTYDFTKFFEKTSQIMSSADFTIANLETTFAGSAAKYSGWPRFNTPDELADTMKDVLGVDMVVTANNHCNDKGFDGVVNTINMIEQRGMLQTGTFKDKESSETALVFEVNGIKISVINYTYSLNGLKLPTGKEFAANMLDVNKIKEDAKKAREAGAEYIICMPHWGIEYALTESKDQREKAKWIFQNTEVDIIVGGHPHVVQPADFVTVTKDGKEKTGYILYSLGNFISSHGTRKDYADTGIVLHVELQRVDGIVSLKKVEYSSVVIDYTPGHVSHNCVRGLEDAVAEYEAGNSATVTKKEYDKFIMYRKYYSDIFKKTGMVEMRFEQEQQETA